MNSIFKKYSNIFFHVMPTSFEFQGQYNIKSRVSFNSIKLVKIN